MRRSQSLRTLELDKRREAGLIVKDAAVVRELMVTFEADWALTDLGQQHDQPRDAADSLAVR